MKITVKNLLEKGFFSEHIPQDSFSLDEVYKILNSEEKYFEEIKKNLNDRGIKSTPCSIFSLYKNDSERRMISILHIETYILLSCILEEHSEIILKKIDNNFHSQSRKIRPIGEDYLNKSDFKDNLYERNIYSMGYKYLLSLDLSKCYENIYTHAISWALLSKKTAKEECIKREEDQKEDYRVADTIDFYIRKTNNNETKGIPTGPVTSRIISELILSEIDRNLSEKSCHFKRYVDDYKFYFHSKEDIQRFIPFFQRLLYDFKLNINHSKTEIKKYPYETENILSNELHTGILKEQGIFSYVNKFNNLYNLGHRGALKYGLKVLSNQKKEDLFMLKDREHQKKVVLSQLINISIVRPEMSQLIIKIIKKNKMILDNEVAEVLNKTLEKSLLFSHDAEIIWLIYFLRNFNLKISTNNVVKILEQEKIISCIYILDYIQVKKLNSDKEIKEAKKKLKENLKKESIYGEKWLLIYECNINNWIDGIKDNLNQSHFLKKLYDKGVKIYKGFNK